MKFATLAIASIAAASGANAFVQNSPATTARSSKTSLPSYLDDIGAPANSGGSSGIANYLDSIPSTPNQLSGAGFVSYLDSIALECNGAAGPSAPCAEAITDYMTAVSSGDAPSSSEGAAAIGNYLDHLASQASTLSGAGIQSYLSTVATAPERMGGAGIGNYLDGVGVNGSVVPSQSAPAVKSYLDALSSGAAAAPAAPAVQEYISNVSSGATSAPTSGSGIASYLDSVHTNPERVGGAGIGAYLATVATSPERIGGAGIGSYLDGISQACNAAQPDTSDCAEAISDYASALSSGAAPAASTGEAAQRIGGYLDALGTSPARAGGAGIPSHTAAMTTNSAISASSATAVKSYLDAMSAGSTASPSAPVVKELLDSVSSGESTGSGIADYLSSLPVTNAQAGGAGIPSYLDSVPSNPNQLSGGGFTSYLDSVSGVPAYVDAVVAQVAQSTPAVAGQPSTTIDTQISQDGSTTTVTITSVTTVVIDDV